MLPLSAARCLPGASVMALIPKSTAGMASHVLTSEVADAIDQICLTGGNFFPMAWFDRGAGDKRGSDAEAANAAAVVAPKPEPVKTEEPAVPRSQAPSLAPAIVPASAPAEAGLVGHLYKGSRVSGQLMFQGPAQIDGNVEGEIQCHGTLTIGDGADVRAKISSQVVIIRGKVEGNVTAREKVELLAPGRMVGNISAPRLTVTEGVVFDGDCSMGVTKQKSGVANSQAVSTDKAAPAQQSDSQK
jgi:cytoskeletal protein CcmA (bactofilin family)